MQKLQFSLLNLAEHSDEPGSSGRQCGEGYRPPFEEFWWTAGPAVLRALDGSTGDRLPRPIVMRLRRWIGPVPSENPVEVLELDALERAYRDLSILHLCCYAYCAMPCRMAQSPLAERRLRMDRGDALAVGKAQECVARIACALHGRGAARILLAAIEHERRLERQIFAMIESIC